MTITAILLLIFASLIHASWNLVSKRENPAAAFFLVANTFGCVLLLPVVIVNAAAFAEYSRPIWILVISTGLCMAVYYAGLAGAYRNGDMSVAYPLARSSPIIVVTIVTVFLGKRHDLSLACILGAGLIVAGCFLVPMKHFADFRFKNYLNLTCAFALMAAFGTAGYSILDDEALHRLKDPAVIRRGVVTVTLLYAFVEGISTNLWLSFFVFARPHCRRELGKLLRERKLICLLTGFSIYAAYAMVLMSMAYVRNISYVVAFRQLSIPLGALLGIILLNERCPPPKAVGVAILCTGLILVGIG